MPLEIINNGQFPNDTSAEGVYYAFGKCKRNFEEVDLALGQLVSQIAAINSNLGGIGTDLSDLNDAVIDLQTRASTLEGQMQAVEASILALSSDVTNLAITSADHTTQINALNSQVDNLTIQVNGLSGQVASLTSDLALKADKDSPALTGTPTAPTPPLGDDSQRLATTEFVQEALDALPPPIDPADYVAKSGDTMTGDLIGTRFIAGSNVVLRGGAAGQPGGQAVLGWGNAQADAITGQATRTWNIDVEGGVNQSLLRIFSIDAGGVSRTPISIEGTTGIISQTSTNFTGTQTFGASTIFNSFLRVAQFTTSGQFSNIADDTAGRVMDFDMGGVSTQAASFRFLRATNTIGPKTVDFFRGDGTGTFLDHRLTAGLSGTLVQFARQGGAMTIGTTNNADTGMGVDVRNGPLQIRTSTSAAAFISSGVGFASQVVFRTDGQARWVLGKIQGAEGGSNAGGDFLLSRNNDDGSYLSDSLRITRSNNQGMFYGSWMPGSDNNRSLGGPSNRWDVVYAGTGTINTSDANAKTGRDGSAITAKNDWRVSQLTESELIAARNLAKEIGVYKWKESIAAKGDAARLHVGLTTQRVVAIMEAEGLDPWAYGMICRDDITRTVKIVEKRKVTVQKTEPCPNKEKVIEIVAGVPTVVLKDLPPQLVFDVAPIIDENGNPVLEAVERPTKLLGPNGEPTTAVEMKPIMHPVPVMIEVEEEIMVEVEEVIGERLGLRYDQISLFIIAGQASL